MVRSWLDSRSGLKQAFHVEAVFQRLGDIVQGGVNLPVKTRDGRTHAELREERGSKLVGREHAVHIGSSDLSICTLRPSAFCSTSPVAPDRRVKLNRLRCVAGPVERPMCIS